MALPELLGNNYQTTINQVGGIASGDASVTVQDALPSSLVPSLSPSGGQFRALIDSEIIIATATSGTGNVTWTISRGADGTTAAAHANGATVTHIVTAESLGILTNPTPGFRAHDAGLLLATYDPLLASNTYQALSGYIHLSKIWVPRVVTIANLIVNVNTAGSGFTGGQSRAGIYDSNGNLIAQTADQSGIWTTAGRYAMALTAQGSYSLTLSGGSGVFYWAALLSVATTTPKFSANAPTTVAGSATVAGAGASPSIGFGYPYATTIPGAKHRAGFESVGGRTNLIPQGAAAGAINGLTVTDQFLSQMIWFGVN